MNNYFWKDKRLHPTTKGILGFLLTNRDDWKIYPEVVASELGISRNTVDKHFKILIKFGYMKVEKVSSGRSSGVIYERYISDVPMSDDFFEYIKQK
ncbi:TPA: helix-turn-helix domain-containing protein [Streptococcus suis]